jgi:hypothetical protein
MTDNMLAVPIAAAHDVASVRSPKFWAKEVRPGPIAAAIAKKQATWTAFVEVATISARSLRPSVVEQSALWLSRP